MNATVFRFRPHCTALRTSRLSSPSYKIPTQFGYVTRWLGRLEADEAGLTCQDRTLNAPRTHWRSLKRPYLSAPIGCPNWPSEPQLLSGLGGVHAGKLQRAASPRAFGDVAFLGPGAGTKTPHLAAVDRVTSLRFHNSNNTLGQ